MTIASTTAPMNRFDQRLRTLGVTPLRRATLETLQVNLGKVCNQACQHCHVDAGPARTESMSRETAERVIALLRASPSVQNVDITGGAPELNPHFRWLVEAATDAELAVIDRCNLTVLFEPGQEDLAEFLASHRVRIVASLPCYGPDNVDAQRGRGVFGTSIRALRRLNGLGYGVPGSGLTLDLVYNPLGPTLPPSQVVLESTYKARLAEDFDVRFDHLLTLANLPISRFEAHLRRRSELRGYMELLAVNFNQATVDGLMCRHLVSVAHDGRLYDCDFNQMLALEPPIDARTIWDIDSLSELLDEPIATAAHCFGCTAGAGSSCGGALSA